MNLVISLLGGTSSILRTFLGGTSQKRHPVVDLEKNDLNGVEDGEEPTDELVVVVLQLLLGVPAVAIVRSVSHFEVLELELKSYVLSPWLLVEHWTSICTLL